MGLGYRDQSSGLKDRRIHEFYMPLIFLAAEGENVSRFVGWQYGISIICL